MIKEQNQFLINQPINKVFDFLKDDGNLHLWVNGIVSIEPIGTPQNQVGDAVMIHVNIPKEMSIQSTLTEFSPPQQFSTAYQAGNMTGTMTYRLVDEGGSTQVTYEAEHHPKGFWMRLLKPVIGMVLRKERSKELLRLKNVLEQSDEG